MKKDMTLEDSNQALASINEQWVLAIVQAKKFERLGHLRAQLAFEKVISALDHAGWVCQNPLNEASQD
jgi:hypothetical protein